MTRLRAFVLVLGGLPVSGGILGAFTTLAALSVIHGPPLPRGDWIAGAVFLVLALGVAAIAVRAFLRVRREGGASAGGPELLLLAKGSPVLLAVGFGLGVWFGMNLAAGRLDADRRAGAELCEAPMVLGLDAVACAERLSECRLEAWASPIHDHNDADVVRLHGAISDRMATVDDPVARNAYLRTLGRLTSDFTVADFDRRTLVCLTR